jgi:tetratricopeptide (TPR) repeat protein
MRAGRGKDYRAVLRPAVVAGVVLTAGLGFALWRQVISSEGASREVAVAQPPSIDQSGVDPAVLRLVTAARSAVVDTPHSAEAWGRLGKILLAHGLSDEALPCFAEAERLDPRQPRWPFYQGTILSQGDPDAAIPKLQGAADLCGKLPGAPRLRLADLLLGQGRLGEAEDQWQRLLSQEPGHCRAHLGLARLAYQRGNPEQSMSHLNIALNGSRTRKASHLLLAEIYQRRGDKPAADQESRRAAALPDDESWPDPFDEEVKQLRTGRQVFLARADRFIRQGRVADAIGLLERTVHDYPDSGEAWLLMGKAYLAKNDARAEQALRTAVRLAPDLVEAPFYLGAVRFLRGDYREAAAHFRQAVKLKPDFALAHYNLGHCLVRLGDRSGATLAFRTAVSCKPDYADARVNLGELLAQDGREAEALGHLRYAVQLEPRDPRAKKLLAQVIRNVPFSTGP